MRLKNDPTWATILSRWRYGDYREEDVDYVNTKCYNENWKSTTAETKAFCPIIVTSNTLRCEFNEESAEVFCQTNSEPLHQFPAIVTRERFQLSRNEQRSLKQLRDDKTGNMSIVLNLAIGMPVQCTQNVSRALKLANGTIGHVISFEPDRDDKVRTVVKLKANGGLNVCIHSKPPRIVFMKLLDYGSSSIVEGFPSGIIPVFSRDKTGVSVELPERTFSIQVYQSPLVPAFSLISEKCQGLTVQKVIIGPLRHSTRKAPQRSSFYVAITRVTSLVQLYLTEKLTVKYLSYFTPNNAALQETRRLEALEQQCDERHRYDSP